MLFTLAETAESSYVQQNDPLLLIPLGVALVVASIITVVMDHSLQRNRH